MSLTFPALKPFPLIPKLVVNEFPQWDTEDFPNNIQDKILELENTIEIDYYEDIFEENHYIHKLGAMLALPNPVSNGPWIMNLFFK